ncbi:MAG: exodeoxyribonuclease V subunit gamma [Wenzhouxiangella sp.]
MNHTIPTGLAIVQSNSPARLRDLLIEQLRRQPLAPLEPEHILTQSNGIGRWLQLALAQDAERDGLGIAASTVFELPARFFWQLYGTVLGEAALADQSLFDAGPLRWRLYGLLPGLVDEAVFSPLEHYLAGAGDAARRRWQLAGELAELYEQYQIYRADWLADWEQGDDRLRDARGEYRPIDERQAWQPALWRRLLASVPDDQRQRSRAHLHQAFVQRLQQAAASGERIPGLPRRVVVFGISSLPAQMVDALAALAEHSQVLVCLNNPCRHYWADLIEGRDLLRSRPGKRLNIRPDWPAQLDDDQLHEFANPLLAAWGRQGRDFFALLDHYDQPERYRGWFDRIDLFDELADDPAQAGLLAQVQQGILDLEPRQTDPARRRPVDPGQDNSVRFHAAHSRQRELEILHDQLLAALEDDPTLQPRDIIVMVPDIDAYAPHIEAVFGARLRSGQTGAGHDVRAIPFSIADRRERLVSATLKAFMQLLDLPRLRLTASEVIDLLNVPAVQRRFGIEPDQVDRLAGWLGQAGVRWGLDGQHRASLGLSNEFQAFSWLFGVKRMLLGYAAGDSEPFDDILPFDEVAGSDADLAGRLAELIDRLHHHWQVLSQAHPAEAWVGHLRSMMEDCLDVSDETDELAAVQLDQALDELGQAALQAELDEPLPLEVIRDALTQALDQGHVSHRFLAGKVNFSTLMPMRAIPFRMVCLLGMNDGDYPRTRKPADFDLMADAKQQRPGDRSRREDDRYLFLEALLAAGQQLTISWIGRSIHNDEPQPPSVLVGQLRDHLACGWCLDGHQDPAIDAGQALLERLTTWHPLQPFSPAYFGQDPALFTYAAEWRLAHRDQVQSTPSNHRATLNPWPLDGPLTVDPLSDFLRQPLAHFTRQRLGARLDQDDDSLLDSEPFSVDALGQWALAQGLLDSLLEVSGDDQLEAELARFARHQRLSGALPLGEPGEQALTAARESVLPILGNWQLARQHWPQRSVPGPVRLDLGTLDDGQPVIIEQWLPELHQSETGQLALLTASATRLGEGKANPPSPRWDKLVRFWPMHLLINAAGFRASTVIAHGQGLFEWSPIAAPAAREALAALVTHWQAGLCRPLPVSATAGTAFVAKRLDADEHKALAEVRKTFDDGFNSVGEASRHPAVARWYPTAEMLLAAGRPGDDFAHWAEALYGPPIRHHQNDAGDES